MVLAAKAVKDGEADAVLSAGNMLRLWRRGFIVNGSKILTDQAVIHFTDCGWSRF